MSISPRDLLAEARRIAKDATNEPSRRSAIGRAYYAAFHGAKRYQAALPFPGRSLAQGGEHENLINQLRYPDSRVGPKLETDSQAVGAFLLRPRPMRIRADYELAADIEVGEMNDALQLASQILNICDPKPKLL